MKINEENIVKVLEIYKPEQRLLRTADIQYPAITGTFLIGKTYYVNKPLKHATDIEIQLCLNQLAYVGLSEAIRQRLDPILDGLNFQDLQEEGMYIIESRKRFRRPIYPNKIISGKLKLKEKRDFNNLLLCEADFSFEDKSCFGSLELAIVRNAGGIVK
ncbi:hypothetical protein HYV50_01855 [Candidatus Pacearchaeota archaeon]|nr:hypothetical protein [Candidatus Pacearchaeota archaeon]